MINAVCNEDGAPTFAASVNGIAIYLDYFAIKTLAKGDGSLRQRFVAAVNQGADLLFSVTNGIEISAAQGASSKAIRAFLDDLGPHWYPVELDSLEIVKREQAGKSPSKCCLAEGLLTAFFSDKTSDHAPGSGKIISLSDEFFRLGDFVDWLSPKRDWFLQRSRAFDAQLKASVQKLRVKHSRNPGWLDRVIPTPQFHPAAAGTFARACLMRQLISDRGYQVKKGDGLDLCHAVVASAFANFATLDKQWKRRVENFPKPNNVARVYYEPQLSAMIADVETALSQLKTMGRHSRDYLAR